MDTEAVQRKRAVLERSNLGARVAEEEADELAKYFVETDQWRRVLNGDVDIVYGPKGSGKSALYSLLLGSADDLFDRGIVILAAERPRGAPAFRDVVNNPPTTEWEFVALWKLYFLCLIAELLRGASPEAVRLAGPTPPVGSASKPRGIRRTGPRGPCDRHGPGLLVARSFLNSFGPFRTEMC